MPRPRKWKKVCSLPESNLYGALNGPRGDSKVILMSVEEYETIRLIDLERLTQEECSIRMQAARTTIQRIYTLARTKVAESLVNGCILKIEGGDYQLCDRNVRPCGKECCGIKLNN